MENKHYSDIVGNSNAPYIQSLIAGGTLFTNYQAGPGSLPDYLAMTSGLTGSTSGSNNIFNQLQTAGISWGEYLESMPSTCYTGGDTGSYKKAHNPAVYYNDITSSPSACANVVPYTQFSPSHLRAFSYLVPNLADDMHDGASRTAEIQTGDAWLAANVPAMLNAGAEVILTWDEGSSATSMSHDRHRRHRRCRRHRQPCLHPPGAARRPRGRLGLPAPERRPDRHAASDLLVDRPSHGCAPPPRSGVSAARVRPGSDRPPGRTPGSRVRRRANACTASIGPTA